MASFISFSNILSFHCINLLPLLIIPNYLILYVALGNAIALVIFFPGGSSWACENATNCCILTWCLAAAWKSFICYNSCFQWCLQSSIHQWSCPCPVWTEMICPSSAPHFCSYLFLGLELQHEFRHGYRSICWSQAPCLALDLKGEDLHFPRAVVFVLGLSRVERFLWSGVLLVPFCWGLLSWKAVELRQMLSPHQLR